MNTANNAVTNKKYILLLSLCSYNEKISIYFDYKVSKSLLSATENGQCLNNLLDQMHMSSDMIILSESKDIKSI